MFALATANSDPQSCHIVLNYSSIWFLAFLTFVSIQVSPTLSQLLAALMRSVNKINVD